MNNEVTQVLEAWHRGDEAAYQRLFDLTYDQLKILAMSQLKKHSANTLSPTELVHEVFLRLEPYRSHRNWENRAAFYGLISKVMMRLLVDRSRDRQALKKGGHLLRVSLADEIDGRGREVDATVLADMVERLTRMDERCARIWQCRYLCGLSMTELGDVFQLGQTMLKRELKTANGWLRSKMMPRI